MKYWSILLLAFILVTCKKYVPSTVTLGTLPITINGGQAVKADNYSVIPILLSKEPDSLSDSVKINVQSTLGKILDTPARFVNGVATIYWKATEDTGTCFLRMLITSSGNLLGERDTSFAVQTADPDSIAIETSQSIAVTTSPNLLYTYLLRKTGFVTKGHTVTWLAYQTNGSGQQLSVGRFMNITDNFSDSLGRLSPISFFSDTKNIDTTQNVFIVASAYNDSGQPVRDTIHLTY